MITFLLPLLKRYWTHVLLVLGVALILYQVYDFIGDKREAKVRAEYEKKALELKAEYDRKIAVREAMLDEFQDLVTQQSIDSTLRMRSLQDEADRLSRALNAAQLTATTEVPSENGTCHDSKLSDSYRVCFNAAITRSPDDIAACEAAGVSGAVPPVN